MIISSFEIQNRLDTKTITFDPERQWTTYFLVERR